MTEQRFKLTEKQYQIYTQSRLQFIQLKQALDAAQGTMASVSELILDRFGLDPNTAARVDDLTKELVVTEPELDAKKPAGSVKTADKE